MLLTLYSLWEEQAANNVVVVGEGVAANPAAGDGLVLIRRGTVGGGIGKRNFSLLRRLGYRVVVPPVDVKVAGEGVRAHPHVTRGVVIYDVRVKAQGANAAAAAGRGSVIINVDFSDEELVALLLAA